MVVSRGDCGGVPCCFGDSVLVCGLCLYKGSVCEEVDSFVDDRRLVFVG